MSRLASAARRHGPDGQSRAASRRVAGVSRNHCERAAERTFDRRRGIDTAGVMHDGATPYQPVHPDAFAELGAYVPVRATFVDIGGGRAGDIRGEAGPPRAAGDAMSGPPESDPAARSTSIFDPRRFSAVKTVGVHLLDTTPAAAVDTVASPMRPAELTILHAGAQVLGTMPAGLGQFRLAQRWWWWRRPTHRVLEQQIAGGPRLLLDIGDRTQALAYMTRRYSPEIVAAITSRLPATGGTFVDVGANVGLITFQVAHRRPAARTVAFEPNPAAAELWRRNRSLNGSGRAELEVAAVSDAPGVLTFHAPDHDLGAGRVEDGKGVTVRALTLDAHCSAHGIDAIDVLKLDIEGSEPAALDGAKQLLAAGAIRAVVMEVNEPLLTRRGSSRAALLERLHAQGMRLKSSSAGDDVVFELAR